MKKFAIILIIILFPIIAVSQDTQLLELESAIIDFLQTDSREDIETFQNKWVLSGVEDLTVDYLEDVRFELRPYLYDVGIDGGPSGLTFYFASDAGERSLKVGLRGVKITSMSVHSPENTLMITSENIHSVIDSLESSGFAGLIYVEKEGREIIEQPFGFANKELEILNSLHTIFGTGSRPIDYTIAAILLLDQQEKLNVDDSITSYFENVPADKHSMTLRHLMNGESGLPDFFEIEGDWDPDLQWISRAEAEQRLLNIELLFEPGSDRQHSHAAFGLLAAVIERVSGVDYYQFLNNNFFKPAGMTRTGEYGSSMGFSFSEFAVGGGPEFVGSPNIPPNWGPTSWLVKGSGGMYSTLGDLQKFYDLVRSGEVLDEEHNRYFRGEAVSLDGSMRGFELFSISVPEQNTSLYLFLNNIPDRDGTRPLFRALEKFVLD